MMSLHHETCISLEFYDRSHEELAFWWDSNRITRTAFTSDMGRSFERAFVSFGWSSLSVRPYPAKSSELMAPAETNGRNMPRYRPAIWKSIRSFMDASGHSNRFLLDGLAEAVEHAVVDGHRLETGLYGVERMTCEETDSTWKLIEFRVE